MTPERQGRGSDQFPLRLPDGMRSEIKEAARANQRSMNSEIVARLEASKAPSLGALRPIFENFDDDTAAIARVTFRLSSVEEPPHDIVVLSRDLAARIRPFADASKRSVHDEVASLLDERFPDTDGLSYGAIAAGLRQIVEADAAAVPATLTQLLRLVDRKIAADHSFAFARI